MTLSIDDLIEYTGPQARKNNRLAQYREDIFRLRQEGSSCERIRNYLSDRCGLVVSEEAVRKYCKRYIDSKPTLTDPPVALRLERTKAQGGPPTFEHSPVAKTPPSNAHQPRTNSRSRLQSPSVSDSHARPASNVASQTAALQQTESTPVSSIDAVATESLIPAGFFGPASQLNPPFDANSKEHRAVLDALETETLGKGGTQSRRSGLE